MLITFESLHFCGTVKGILPGGGFQSDPAQGLWALCLKCMVPSTIGTYLSSLGEGCQPRTIAIAYDVFTVFWMDLTKSSKVSYSCLVLGFFVRSSMTLGVSIVSPDGNILVKLYMYTLTYRCYRYFWVDHNTIPYDSFYFILFFIYIGV